ncbi:MAG: DUF4230 domain-containing protein [Prevotella sp.]|nr:DUF4230 domain-containing protein [Prevotella sp.]
MAKRNNWLLRLLGQQSNSLLTTITTVIVLLTVLFAFIAWFIHGLSVKVENNNHVTISETQIQSLRDIGEWEFLAINDEELVDSVRHGMFSDDELTRIYYGTLRLGIDMGETEDGWISVEGDTITAILPPVKLLDDNFIDEARTKAFYGRGTWNQQARAKLYEKARRQMLSRCLTPSNMESARQNASSQFYSLLQSMGFKHIKIRFADQGD